MFKPGDVTRNPNNHYWSIVKHVSGNKVFYVATRWVGAKYHKWGKNGHDLINTVELHPNPKPRILEYMKALTKGEI